MKIMKILIAAILASSLFALSVNAQTAPNAEVNQDGELVIDGGDPIPVPDGTVDTATGDLVLSDGTRIEAPDAQVQANGSLLLGNGETLAVPSSPRGGEFIINWFGDDLYDMRPDIPVTENQQYWSYTFKFINHFASNNWFWFQEWKTTFYINPDTGTRNLDDGVWFYTYNLFPGQTQGTWVYFARKYLMHDLRDPNYDGVNEIADALAGYEQFEGSIFVINPDGYSGGGSGSGWFLMKEWPDGNYIIRRSQEVPNPYTWVKLSDPVAPSPADRP